MSDHRTQGIVIGTRKAGTTWLYENFRKDPRVQVSEKVKESGFFAGMPSLNAARYDDLFDGPSDLPRLEVDTSVCYHPEAADLIDAYNPDMKVVLIFREPAAFLDSRHTHSLRKGEVSEPDSASALEAHAWLRAELDYPAIVERFSRFQDRNALTILTYEHLKSDPRGFYSDVLKGLGLPDDGTYQPDLERVNVSRESNARFLSALFSKGAIAARSIGLHGLVNRLKSLGFHKKIERQRAETQIDETYARALEAVTTAMPETVAYHRSL